MEPVRDVPILEQPAFLLRLQHGEPRHVRISVYAVTGASVYTAEVDFGLADLFVELDATLHAERLVHRLVHPRVHFGVEEGAPALLVPQHSRRVRRETERHPLDFRPRIPRCHIPLLGDVFVKEGQGHVDVIKNDRVSTD